VAPGLAARVLAATVLAAMVLATGCQERPPASTDPAAPASSAAGPGRTGRGVDGWPDAEACSPLAGPIAPGGDLVVALGEAVSPHHAPVPHTDAERVVFAGCYETLVQVACTGELAPGLASAWQRFEGGRRWRLTLREGALFWDGRPVTAHDVIDAWSRNLTMTRDRGLPCPGLWLETGRRGVVARGARVVEIRLAEPQDDLPRLLAHPALAVAAHRPGWLWPVGSGPCRLAADTGAPLPDLLCRPNRHHPAPPPWRSLTVRVRPAADPRDLLTGDADLAVLRDRHAREFYAGLPEVVTTPLPWDRKYVLLLTAAAASPERLAASLEGADVTRSEGRPAGGLTFRRCTGVACPQLRGPTVSILTPPRDPDPAHAVLFTRQLFHADDDPDATALAARVAARLGDGAVARPLPTDELIRAVQDASGLGVVVRLDACYPAPCLTLAALLARGPWLQATLSSEATDACSAAADLLASGRVVPLADTRAYLAWRGPVAGLRLAHDGTPLLGSLGVAAAETAP
jgi:peptide/nickel transport system substrate-binding protein